MLAPWVVRFGLVPAAHAAGPQHGMRSVLRSGKKEDMRSDEWGYH